MLVTALGADGSDSGMGKLAYEATDQAITFASHFTRELSLQQILALDTFVGAIKDRGIWGNVQQLYLPFIGYIAGNNTALLDSFIDLKQSWDSETLVKNTSATNSILQNNYKYANGGIERLTVPANYSDVAKMFRLQESVLLSSKDSHAFIFKMSGTYPSSDSQKRQYFGFNFSESLKNPEFNQQSASIARIGIATVSSNNSISLSASAEDTLIGYASKDGVLHKKGDGLVQFNISSETEYTLNNPLYFGPIDLNITIGVAGIGTGILGDDLIFLETAIKNLKTFF